MSSRNLRGSKTSLIVLGLVYGLPSLVMIWWLVGQAISHKLYMHPYYYGEVGMIILWQIISMSTSYVLARHNHKLGLRVAMVTMATGWAGSAVLDGAIGPRMDYRGIMAPILYITIFLTFATTLVLIGLVRKWRKTKNEYPHNE